MQVKIVSTDDGKRFVWQKDSKEKSESNLPVWDFESFSNYKVIRGGTELDRGQISEPRGDRYYFSGLDKIYPAGGNYFLGIPVEPFEVGDVIEFSNTW